MNQYLTFHLGGEEYAVSVLEVTEIIECASLTRVPGTPPWIRGVINLRGSVVPVVDLPVKFGLEPTALTRRTCVVMVEIEQDGERLVIGIMADSVHQVIDLAPAQIQPPPAFGPAIRVDCIEGMADIHGTLVVLLDIDRVLTAADVRLPDDDLVVTAGGGVPTANAQQLDSPAAR